MCHVYDSKYCKELTIVCCDMHSEDDTTQILFKEKFEYCYGGEWSVNRNFKGLMADNA